MRYHQKKITAEQRFDEADSSESLLTGAWQVLFIAIIFGTIIKFFFNH